MAFLSSRTQMLLWIFILILCGLSVNNFLKPVIAAFPTVSKEKNICQLFPRNGLCTTKYDPVCGKDDVTYINLCYFCWVFRNELKGNVHLNYFGSCKEQET